MQSIKNAILGSSETPSGTEPVSGQTGSGTAAEPYDAGNEAGQPGVESQAGVGSQSGVESQSGSENTFGRDRGGPTSQNHGPHEISIANKLDPKVDSDGDGKPKSGPFDLETTTGPGSSSYSTDQTGLTGAYTGSTGAYAGSTGKSTESTGEYTGSTGGYTGSSGEYSSTTAGYDGNNSSNTGYTSGMRSEGTQDTTGSNINPNMSTDSAPRLGEESDNLSGPGIQQGSNVTGGRPRPEHETDKTGVTSMHSNDPKLQVLDQSSANDSSVESRGQSRGPIGGVGAVEPSVGADPASGQAPKQDHQGGNRPGEEPSSEGHDAIVGEKVAAEKAQSSGAPGGGLHAGQEPESGPGAPSKGEGTGEKWVKTSGMAADGGDFDAAKPGAGREADRLLEEKGVHRDAPGATSSPVTTDTSSSSSKPSIGEKIKEKLHMG